MENINVIIEKLMFNRAALLMKKFDSEFKEILDNDLQAYRSGKPRNSSSNNRKNQLVA